MSVPDLPSLPRCRARARLLLSHVRGQDATRARAAATRLLRLRSFAACSVDELLAAPARVRLKHALTLVAVELGHASWPELKAACAAREHGGSPSAPAAALPAEALYAPRMAFYLNRWFADHAAARASLDAEGGYLLPYRQQCFVACAEAVAELGLDPDDPDWQHIGFDWVRPADPEALARLASKRRAAMG
jgi:hypothetical protein